MKAETDGMDRTGVADWFAGLSRDLRDSVLASPGELSPRDVERRAELAEWVDVQVREHGETHVAGALVEQGLEKAEAEEVVNHLNQVDPTDVELEADDGSVVFRDVAEEVLDSYARRDPDVDARELHDAGDVTQMRLLVARVVAAVSHGDLSHGEVRQRLRRAGVPEEQVETFVSRFVDRKDEIDTHLEREKIGRLSDEIRSLRWDSLSR